MSAGDPTRTEVPGQVYWITGLSGAGKSTLARALCARLRSLGRTAIVLDGDSLREILGNAVSYDADGRLALARAYSRLARLLAVQGVDVVVATISMFEEIFSWNRSHQPNYVEVYLKVPIAELERRDPKGIYAGARGGTRKNVAGIDLIVDEPKDPDVLIEFHPDGELADHIDRILNCGKKA